MRFDFVGRMKKARKAKRRVEISAESVRILGGFQELSQNELVELTAIPQSTLSAIELDRVNLGVERTKVRARALRFHSAVLVFPGWRSREGNGRLSKYVTFRV